MYFFPQRENDVTTLYYSIRLLRLFALTATGEGFLCQVEMLKLFFVHKMESHYHLAVKLKLIFN